jgi:hypothetical protein
VFNEYILIEKMHGKYNVKLESLFNIVMLIKYGWVRQMMYVPIYIYLFIYLFIS